MPENESGRFQNNLLSVAKRWVCLSNVFHTLHLTLFSRATWRIFPRRVATSSISAIGVPFGLLNWLFMDEWPVSTAIECRPTYTMFISAHRIYTSLTHPNPSLIPQIHEMGRVRAQVLDPSIARALWRVWLFILER